ncbi:zinc finger BED domain-containing protein 4-like [Solea solea]|uniref:zinc finger BED domain-containing protein 4-like n=1 Tax=Solea solea TaxID=90069 RepID=UPI00272A3527|nr:zinc finger BED domain-containing protein 4-like [Solea solea]
MVDEAVVNMIIKDSQPFSVVEDVGFRELMHLMDPNYILPSRKALKAMVDIKYQEAKEKAREQVQKAVAVSLTSDMWTSINMDAYLAVTPIQQNTLQRGMYSSWRSGASEIR